ncbi:hypothetical protein AKH05_00930 [Vibrio parahaemolyticus]|uniref:lipopolysaccharide biosynthesis protein n=1 Tax=Vibrio parahaemolyticus TaxID=670 RepID=UPI000813D596|nr:oligosaccharide flippase family protein [Vibrio parahaemolyticus]EJC6862402.1 hypothetical protein [Vibrio parahaemolyticus]EJC7040044.1 hypothetical protein [Vibrio parahaemolyticus]EKA4467576.1 hypothetical protein [Vibrio parahaemolyticus]ELA8155601.1 hypothetical protein [Vibrio parahaemolyticus]OCP62587.1 hypothetical protein AKH05_00930 [Vibrio parahaemolyticus]
MSNIKKIVISSGLYGLLARVISSLSQVIIMPLVYHNYTKEEFNILIVFLSLNVFVSLCGFGVTKSMINKLSSSLGFEERIKLIFNSTFLFLVKKLSIVLVISIFVITIINEYFWNDAILYEMSIYFIINTFLSGVVNFFLDYYKGINKPDISNKILFLINALISSSLFIGAYFQIEITQLYLLSQVGVNLLFCSSSILWFRRKKIFCKLNYDNTKVWCKESKLFLALMLIQFFSFSTDTLILSVLKGAEDAANYNVAYKFYSLYIFSFTAFSSAVWPIFRRLSNERDFKAMSKMIRYGGLITLCYATFAIVVISFISPLFVRYIMGIDLNLDEYFMFLSIQAMLVVTTSAIIPILNAMSVLQEQVKLGVLLSLSNLFLSMIFVNYYGSIGTIWGTIISHTIFGVIPLVYLFIKETKFIFR